MKTAALRAAMSLLAIAMEVIPSREALEAARSRGRKPPEPNASQPRRPRKEPPLYVRLFLLVVLSVLSNLKDLVTTKQFAAYCSSVTQRIVRAGIRAPSDTASGSKLLPLLS